MSQSFSIKVSASVREQIRTKDKTTKKIVLTPIISVEEQTEVLEEELTKKGWQKDPKNGKIWRKQRGKVKETLNLEDMTVESEVEVEATLERTKERTVHGDRDHQNESSLRKRSQDELEKEIKITDKERAAARKRLESQATDTLEDTDKERTEELNEIVQGVYAESLKRKARRLGTVTEVREGQAGEDYELVIKIQQ